MKLPFIAMALAALIAAPLAWSHDYHMADLMIDHPWSRPTPPGTPMGVGYMAITNNADSKATLVGASSPRAGHVSLHQTIMDDGVMRMQPLDNGLEIAPGQTVKLEPNGYHLMLEKLASPLKAGERVPVTLRFRKRDPINIELSVQSLDDAPGMMKENGAMGHSGHSME
ncbi:copper chaperone PCu(A)C [Marinobacter oulmenensis]|uniref:Copper chaperone PCu(A)C n=1 Tax=Marinobacter oulmenensis TaxID=643747 RepID=A0A840UDK1_9GAMM|nr:copper chaperone PCu(A)C [Marinobacter oulmenensis]MBB5321450.1 hypothetical protein [Marinobacter oulmenensis]